jgi:beta-xylosidase
MAWLDLKHAELMRALLAVVRATRPAFDFLALADIYTAAERLHVNDVALVAMLEHAMMATSQQWNSNTARQLLDSFARV